MAYSLSPGLIYSAIELFNLARLHPLPGVSLERDLARIGGLRTGTVLEFAFDANMVTMNEKGNLIPSLSTREWEFDSFTANEIRQVLRNYILHQRPSWASLIPRGRTETGASLSRETRQCFADADLFMAPPSIEIVDWWDNLAAQFRAQTQQNLLELGRCGERLSLLWERLRTRQVPQWISIETNLAGYDILSIVSSSNQAPLTIEVKATSHPLNRGCFYLSREEWDFMDLSPNHHMHLWVLEASPILAVIDVASVASHIAVDNGRGEWQSTKVPMSAFVSHFINVMEEPGFAELVGSNS